MNLSAQPNGIPQIEWFKQKNLLSHYSRDWESKIKVLAKLFFGQPFFLAFRELPSSYGFSSTKVRKEDISGDSSSSYKDISPIKLEPHHMALFNLNYLPKGPISNSATLALRFQHTNLGSSHNLVPVPNIWGHNKCDKRAKMQLEVKFKLLQINLPCNVLSN